MPQKPDKKISVGLALMNEHRDTELIVHRDIKIDTEEFIESFSS